MDEMPPNLRYVVSCADCDHSTQKSSGYFCHKYQLLVGDVIVCDSFKQFRETGLVLRLVKKEK